MKNKKYFFDNLHFDNTFKNLYKNDFVVPEPEFNITKVKQEDLKEDEVLCPKCDGEIKVLKNPHDHTYWISERKEKFCEKCNNEGKLTWVENLVGKKKSSPSGFDGTSYTYTTAVDNYNITVDLMKIAIEEYAEKMKNEIDKLTLENFKIQSKLREVDKKIDN